MTAEQRTAWAAKHLSQLASMLRQ